VSRAFPAGEWRLAAAGIVSGMITALLVILVWARGPWMPGPFAAGAASGGPGAIVGAFGRQVAEGLEARPIERRPLSGWLNLKARDVVWREPGTGRLFVSAPAVTARIDASAANRRDIVLDAVVLQQPRLELITDGSRWNYERPLAGLLAEPVGEPEREVTFLISNLRLVDGSVGVDMPQTGFALRDVEAQLADVELSSPGLPAPRLELTSASADLSVAGRERTFSITGERGQLSFPSATTQFDVAVLTVAGTRLERVSGVWDPGGFGYGLSATGTVPAVRLADLDFLALEHVPDEGTARFGFALAPAGSDGTAIRITDLSLAAGESRLTGSLAAEAGPSRFTVEQVDLRLQDLALSLLEPITGALPYRGRLTGTVQGPGSAIRVDVAAGFLADSANQRFSTRVAGEVSLTSAGLAMRDLRAELTEVPLGELRRLIPGLPLGGRASGTLVLNGAPSKAPLRVEARVELGTGLTTLGGTLDFTDSVPRYDIAGRLVGIDLQSILATPAPPVVLNAQFAAAGRGFEPATADAHLRLDGRFSGWQAAAGDTIAAVAAVGAGSLQLNALSLRLAGATAALDGNWRFIEPVSGGLNYQMAMADLAPFGPYLPKAADSTAAGSLNAAGTIAGPLDSLRFEGTLEGTGLRAGRWGAARLESTYRFTLAGSPSDADVRLTGEGITTAGAGTYASLVASARLAASDLRFEVRGEHTGGGQVVLQADGSIPPDGARSLLLRQGWFDLPEGRWELQSPARLDWGGQDGVQVTGLLLRNARTSGAVSVEGRLLPLARLDARLTAADLPLDQLQDLLGRDRVVTGRLWADMSVRPPGASPSIQGTFRLEQGTIEGVALGRVEGSIDYAGGAARTELTAAFDSAGGRLEVRGTLPLRVVLGDSLEFGLAEGAVLDATVTAERASLRPFGLLVPRVRNLAGMIDGTVALQGTVADPRLSGDLNLSDGRLDIPELNQGFDSVAGTVSFGGRTAEIRDLRVHRGGWARMNGTVTFEELDRPVVQVAAELDGFQPIGVDEHPDAGFTGSVTVSGELNSLVVTGRVVIRDGYLAMPQLGTSFVPEYLDAIDPAPVLGREFGVRRGGSWATNARIEGLRATFGEGAWVEAFDATLQLVGDITIDKTGDELRLTGTLTGERGTYTLAAGPIVRRFEIIRSQVRFLGSPEPNPAIDITARRIVLDPDGRRVEVEVRITGSAQVPRLALASADAPNIPESELLSFLLFGRRTLALGETFATTGGMVFEQAFFGGVAEVAGLELERALSSNLGLQLDLFQVRFGQGFGGLTTPTFVLGRQVANDFFLTVESGLNALLGDAGASASSWAVRLEWAIDPRQALELGVEPLNRARLLRGIGAALPPGRPSQQQLYAEFRRRWAY